MLQLLPYSLSIHNYGPDALDFKPQRWMEGSLEASDSVLNSPTARNTPAGPGQESGAAAAAGVGVGGVAAGPPDPISFLTGPRDW